MVAVVVRDVELAVAGGAAITGTVDLGMDLNLIRKMQYGRKERGEREREKRD